MKHIVVTGATSGMGLIAVRRLAAMDRNVKILVGARSPEKADDLRKAVPEAQLWVSPLDISSLGSV